MVDAGSLRPSKIRRLIVAVARATALFILIAGIYGAAAIAFPQSPVLYRSIASLGIGVVIFELLRPPRRTVTVTVPAETAPPPSADNTAELLEAQNALDQLRAEAQGARERELAAREQFERAASRALEDIQSLRSKNDELRATVESEKNQRRRDVEDAKQKAEVEKAAQRKTMEADWSSRLKESQHELELTRKTAQQMLQSNEALKSQLDEERQRLHAELQRIIAESKSERDEMQAESRAVAARLEELLAQLDRERKLSQELSATRARLAEENLALKKSHETAAQSAAQREHELHRRSGELEEMVNKLTIGHKDQIEQIERERDAIREQIESEWSAKLQKIVTGLTTDHENDIGEAIAAREEARAEARSLTARLSKLESDLLEKNAAPVVDEKELREKIDAEWSDKLQTIVTGLTTDHENDIGEAIAAREEARAEARSLTAKVARLEEQLEGRASPAVDEKELREKIDAEWSAKLQKIVTGLTTDHENDIGDAIAAREAARAEARSLAAKIARLESDVSPAVDEKELREKIDAEWSAKLQTIVSHIASDHEADIGKAIEEREAARAEVRNLNIKITSLQQKLESERQARESLQVRFREAEEQLRNAPTQRMPALVEPPPPPPAPPPPTVDEEKARAEVLEVAEQAFEALRRATSPGTVPIPEVGRKRRILIVHHDPALRSMWRENLTKGGFDVLTAADGLEGLRIANKEKPDVVIADVSMPKMDGGQLCHLIKSNQETADIKVILLTGVYTNEVPLDAATKRYEADELLRKPVKLDAMKTALDNLLKAS